MNALVLLSNALSPSEVDRLRKLVDPPSLAQAGGTLQRSTRHGTRCHNATPRKFEETSGCLATTCHRCGDKDAERSIKGLDGSIAALRKRIWPSSRVSLLDICVLTRKYSLLRRMKKVNVVMIPRVDLVWFKVVEKPGKSMLLD